MTRMENLRTIDAIQKLFGYILRDNIKIFLHNTYVLERNYRNFFTQTQKVGKFCDVTVYVFCIIWACLDVLLSSCRTILFLTSFDYKSFQKKKKKCLHVWMQARNGPLNIPTFWIYVKKLRKLCSSISFTVFLLSFQICTPFKQVLLRQLLYKKKSH